MERNFIIGIGFLITSVAMGQGPMYDRVEVNLPYSVTVNNTVLQPGNYVIREHESTAGGSRIMHFFKDGGMKLETTAMAIPALDNRTPEETKLILDHIGPDYYLNKIWVQGKDYGYEFPIPENVRRRERENSASAVVGQYQAAPAPVVAEQTPAQTTTEASREQSEQRTEIAQAAPPAQPEPAPAAPEPAPAAQAPSQPAQPAPTPSTLPSTAANWLNLMVGGGLLTGSGLALRRFRA
jgi:Tfp pilus assembly protein FimV